MKLISLNFLQKSYRKIFVFCPAIVNLFKKNGLAGHQNGREYNLGSNQSKPFYNANR